MKDANALFIFATVAEEGSFSRAADCLGITKSAVSKRITGLEHQLGVKLLHRTTRKLSLTEGGERYLTHAREAVQAIEDAEAAATELQNVPQGTLKISAPMSFGRLHIAPLIPKFLKTYPEIKIVLDLSDVFPDLVADGFDIALRAGDLKTSSLIARKLVSLRSILCASKAYIEQNGHPETPADLQNHNCVLYSYHTRLSEWVFIKNDEEERIGVGGNYQVNNSEALHEALMQGVGIGRLPTFVASPDLASGQLVPVLEDYRMPEKDLYAVFPERLYLPEKVRVFIDFVVANVGSTTPHWDHWTD